MSLLYATGSSNLHFSIFNLQFAITNLPVAPSLALFLRSQSFQLLQTRLQCPPPAIFQHGSFACLKRKLLEADPLLFVQIIAEFRPARIYGGEQILGCLAEICAQGSGGLPKLGGYRFVRLAAFSAQCFRCVRKVSL